MMKKAGNKKGLNLSFFLWALAGLWVMAGPAGTAGAGPVDRIRIITPMWEGQTNPDGTGLFFEIIRRVFAPEGIQMAYEFAPWKRAQILVKTGKKDAMLCVWAHHARQEGQLIPRYPMYIEHTAAVYKKASIPKWGGIQSLDQRRLVWLRGYDYHREKQMEPVRPSGYQEVDSHEEAWLQLNLDRFDVYMDALIDIDGYIRTHGIDMAMYGKQILWSEKAYPAFSDSDRSRDLIRIFDRQIRILLDTGELKKIYEQWKQPFDDRYWQEGEKSEG